LTMSTPVSELPQTKGRAVWNELFASDAPWPAFVLVNEMVLHLVERNVARINFVSGETVTLPNDLERDPDRYQFFTPKDLPTDVVAGGNRLALGKLENPGVYYLRGKRTEVVQRGLSVNVAANATQLRRLAPEGLEKIFGKDRYRLARSADELVRDVGEARIGREFYPYVMLAIAFLLACEHLLANRFYRREPTSVADTQVELLQRRSA